MVGGFRNRKVGLTPRTRPSGNIYFPTGHVCTGIEHLANEMSLVRKPTWTLSEVFPSLVTIVLP